MRVETSREFTRYHTVTSLYASVTTYCYLSHCKVCCHLSNPSHLEHSLNWWLVTVNLVVAFGFLPQNCSYINTNLEVWTMKGGVDAQTVIHVKKLSNFLHSQATRMLKRQSQELAPLHLHSHSMSHRMEFLLPYFFKLECLCCFGHRFERRNWCGATWWCKTFLIQYNNASQCDFWFI